MNKHKNTSTQNRNKSLLVASAMTILSAITVTHAQSVINGGFSVITSAGSKYNTEIGSGSYRDQTVISGWTAENTGLINSITGYGGGNALTIKSGKSSDSSSARQTISFASPGSFQLSYHSFTEPLVFESFGRYSVRLQSSGGRVIDPLSLSLGESADGETTPRTHSFNISRTGEYELIFANLTDLGNSSIYQDVFIDGVSITSVPEPSSSALVGLGALSLLMRRRRNQ